jgi:hypothetical protein
LRLSDDVIRVCSGSDHAFDALIASLVTRAAAVGLTTRPTAAEAQRARLEGWIAVPHRDSLSKLPTPSPAGR